MYPGQSTRLFGRMNLKYQFSLKRVMHEGTNMNVVSRIFYFGLKYYHGISGIVTGI